MALNGKKIVIGVDGGGTKTQGILYSEDGQSLSGAMVGGSNPHSNPEEKVREALHSLVENLARDAKVEIGDIDGICLGMAGVDRPADKAFIERLMRERIGEKMPLLIVNDAVVAMVAVLGRLHGILVIAGTGSICLGFNAEKGEQARAGGWGHILADEGSGYIIGLGALKAIIHAHDKRSPETPLTVRVLKELNLASPTDIIGWLYMGKNGKTEVAALAPLVHEEAAKGDPVSLRILDEQAGELMAIIRPVYERLFAGTKDVPLALWGGNILNSPTYQKMFLAKLSASGLQLKTVIKDGQAVMGAARHMLNHLK